MFRMMRMSYERLKACGVLLLIYPITIVLHLRVFAMSVLLLSVSPVLFCFVCGVSQFLFVNRMCQTKRARQKRQTQTEEEDNEHCIGYSLTNNSSPMQELPSSSANGMFFGP